MNVLQFNVRLAEGGAAGVALDLHQRALRQGIRSRFIYGYGKGGKQSESHARISHVEKHTPRFTAMMNMALFRVVNRDLFGHLNALYPQIIAAQGPVALHFHVLHSYWLSFKSVVRFCQRVKRARPDAVLVWTLHDHWSVTGRCAFTDGCEGWRDGCKKCPSLDNYPPVKIDRAVREVAPKRALFRQLLALDCRFISPSQHVAAAFNLLYGAGRCEVINNGVDISTEAILSTLPEREAEGQRPKIAVVAHDLRYDGKTDQRLVREIIALGERVEVHTFGKSSPFSGDNVVNHGFITDKQALMSRLNQMDSLLFSSRVDNYPLILCEALSIGVPVIATHSDAAREVLAKTGGKTCGAAQAVAWAQLPKSRLADAIFGRSLASFKAQAREAYSGQQMLEEYVRFYQGL
ncbi:glycosyltransferase [Erwinia sp. HR93]|uniref:glycosyltransferase n=1 Tax=Erwinia sp. HR93 TaxID=3094840 RepID=UPI002ADEFB11|nr:glycosyltransferase [Erwinia sp. HR93]MEA1065421.1 glycosyltransferase [Erwinia sp. HR93]